MGGGRGVPAGGSGSSLTREGLCCRVRLPPALRRTFHGAFPGHAPASPGLNLLWRRDGPCNKNQCPVGPGLGRPGGGRRGGGRGLWTFMFMCSVREQLGGPLLLLLSLGGPGSTEKPEGLRMRRGAGLRPIPGEMLAVPGVRLPIGLRGGPCQRRAWSPCREGVGHVEGMAMTTRG